MKQLQNNFTTPEQSKRLLELGVPVDSTDCCFHIGLNEVFCLNGCTYTDYVILDGYRKDRCIPCWSVGRLIEIYLKCYDGLIDTSFNFEPLDADNIVDLIIERIEKKIYKLDFSKLEE